MNLSPNTLTSENGITYATFLDKVKEFKKFTFTLDGHQYTSDEYEMEGCKFWRLFKNKTDIVPMEIFLSFDEYMNSKVFFDMSFVERFNEITIDGYEIPGEETLTDSSKNDGKNDKTETKSEEKKDSKK